MSRPTLGEISYVHQAGRGAGKTYKQMTAVHEAVLAGDRVLVVFLNLLQYDYWLSEWRRRFPQVRPPDYVTINSVDRTRGRRVTKIFIENVDEFPDGIYNEKLQYLWLCLDPTVPEQWEVYFTSSYIDLNWKSHNKRYSASEIRRRTFQRMHYVT